MSCPGDNYVVPGANPCGGGGGGGVQSVGAGTPNVTITGSGTNPLINVTNLGGVTQVEGQTGNVNFNGVGITIVGGSPVAGDVTLTAAVQNITGSGGTVVTQPTAGTFNIASPTAAVQNVTAGGGITVTNPTPGTFQVASVVQNITGSGGGITVTQPTAGTFNLAVPANAVNNITGSGIATVTQPTTGTFNVAVPSPTATTIVGTGGGITVTQPTPGNFSLAVPSATVTNITGSGGGITVTQPSTGVFNLAVPPNTVTNVTGSGIATVTQPTTGVFNVAVPAPVVTNVTGSGSAIVTSAGGVFNVAVNAGGAADNAVLNPSVNPVFVSGPAVDGDTAIFLNPVPFTGSGNSLIGNLTTANVIIVNFSCGPLVGAPTSGPTNASYFSIYGKTSGGTGTSVYTQRYGFYVLPYNETCYGDFQVTFYKARGEFFGDTTSFQIWVTNVTGVPFSNAIQCTIQIPTVSVNVTSF